MRVRQGDEAGGPRSVGRRGRMPRDRGRRRDVTAERPPEVVVTGRRAVLEAVRAGVTNQVLVAREARSSSALRDVVEAAAAAGIAVRDVSRQELDAFADDHRGVAARVRPPRYLGERRPAEYPFAG